MGTEYAAVGAASSDDDEGSPLRQEGRERRQQRTTQGRSSAGWAGWAAWVGAAAAAVPFVWLAVALISGDRSLRIDGLVVLGYLGAIMFVGLRAQARGAAALSATAGSTADEFFLAGRSLRWPSIAMSVIATNIDAGQFIGYAGGSYLYGLAQAQFEWSACVNLLVCVFCFVPGFVGERCTTITQFLERRVGRKVALLYSLSNLTMFATMILGAALFWGAFLLDALFSEFLLPSVSQPWRLLILGTGLGIFSAVYTTVGGMAAVVRTDIVQCGLMLIGGAVLTSAAISRAGGWSEVESAAGPAGLLSVHLPADHPVLPWTGTTALYLIGLNYWGSNQVILQRALAARSLRDAQLGLLVGGCLKFITGVLCSLPAVSLRAQHMRSEPPTQLDDPDLAYMVLLREALPVGARGVVLCGVFASLMSSVDSTLNSIATMSSVDVFSRWRPGASEAASVRVGRGAIMAAVVLGVGFLGVNIFVKLLRPDIAIINTLTEIRYFFTK
eukprot:COSAG04_NODE_776_length_10398_cov_2.756870_10_plen_500_part_00